MKPPESRVQAFYKYFSEGWSLTCSCSKAKLTGVQYKYMVDNIPSFAKLVSDYKVKKKRKRSIFPVVAIYKTRSNKQVLIQQTREFISSFELPIGDMNEFR